MKYYFITGTSSGLGNALCRLILEDRNSRVIGISRQNTINHDQYTHFHLDLSDIGKLKSSVDQIFRPLPDVDRIVLINNAATLGQVGHLGNLNNDRIHETLNLNVIAPAILTNGFLHKYYHCNDCHKVILNISSGAGKRPTDGWSLYCSSKAAVDMLSEVGSVEKQKDHQNLKIFSVSPGIVDTPMQDQIRELRKEDFSRVEEFIEYKKENMLVSPEKVAKKILHIIEHDQDFHEPLLSVRSI
jgi:benzil reductase ((S)-benzoin forming)